MKVIFFPKEKVKLNQIITGCKIIYATRSNQIISSSSSENPFLINVFTYIRKSHQTCSMKQRILKNFTNFTGKHFCWSLF